VLTRVVSLIIGYCLGCVLTAEIIAKKYAGKSSSEIGTTGNPGMANIMAHLGFGPGIRVLLGDVGKTMLAMLISWFIFRHES
jgi:glycerol-3-phosphate acyltransferase PlsY